MRAQVDHVNPIRVGSNFALASLARAQQLQQQAGMGVRPPCAALVAGQILKPSDFLLSVASAVTVDISAFDSSVAAGT